MIVKHKISLIQKRLGGASGKLLHYITRKKVNAIISRTSYPMFNDAENQFNIMQSLYPKRDNYKYDQASLYQRAYERAGRILKIASGLGVGNVFLEIGAGDGLVGASLYKAGKVVELSDLEDWRHADSKKIPFLKSDLSASLNICDSKYDFIYSYNTFEHLPDPGVVMRELVRVSQPGGLIYLSFNPLYASPWGLHAYRTLHMPYSQFLFSEDFIDRKLQELGVIDLGGKRAELQPLNRWKPWQYMNAWHKSGCTIEWVRREYDTSHLQLVMDYPDSFQGRSLCYEDLITSGFEILLRTPQP